MLIVTLFTGIRPLLPLMIMDLENAIGEDIGAEELPQLR